ncbi:hypothetical protein KF282_0950 [Lactococcus lactis subsp. lactis]|uniref:Lipoprotein n=1 Tax=Lactococcus lactis subsp. lactis TaxID=1360 RepID=A0A0V8CZU4_LACLL|nr:hypothetical protein [Lactococcus lactis]KSU06553.1 hypothetical protein KF282_0950 [Lactococcus lactis subsp. lactis]
MKKIMTTLFLLFFAIILVGCSNKSVVGTYVATDGQTLSLTSDGKVEYSDPQHDDTSTGTWTIKDNKVYIDRTNPDGVKRRQIYAEIPKGKIDSLFFKVTKESDGRGTFTEQIFTKKNN